MKSFHKTSNLRQVNALIVCAVKALVHSGGIPARELVRSTR
jgi:hypothetical protein